MQHTHREFTFLHEIDEVIAGVLVSAEGHICIADSIVPIVVLGQEFGDFDKLFESQRFNLLIVCLNNASNSS